MIEANKRSRDKLTRSLESFGLHVFPSQTNFLLVRFPDPDYSAEAACSYLRRQGIAVRRFASSAYQDCVRITLGLDFQILAASEAIDAFLQGTG